MFPIKKKVFWHISQAKCLQCQDTGKLSLKRLAVTPHYAREFYTILSAMQYLFQFFKWPFCEARWLKVVECGLKTSNIRNNERIFSFHMGIRLFFLIEWLSLLELEEKTLQLLNKMEVLGSKFLFIDSNKWPPNSRPRNFSHEMGDIFCNKIQIPRLTGFDR